MTWRVLAVMLLLFLSYGCATTVPPSTIPEVLRGIASWYGEEFAGRTTANGEIFDPLQLTAAHRTLPFGTLIDVTNEKTKQTVRVRINDRGPYVGNRIIDLSYAAAQLIGLIEPGTGAVEIAVVKMGRGEREPPAPFEVTIQEPAEKVVISNEEPPKVAFPLPAGQGVPSSSDEFTVEVVQERQNVPTRRQVAADGRTIEEVPIDGSAPIAPAKPAAPVARAAVAKRSPAFVVQVGAFSSEGNAKALQERLTRIGQKSYIDRESLYRVRIGPFSKRDEAVAARTALEASGLSAMILLE